MRKLAFIILIALLGIDYGAGTYAATPIRPGDEIFISRRHKGDVPIGDVFSEWRYIPLEKTDKSVVMDASRTKRVLTSKEGLIYVLDQDKVMRFRPDGHLDHVYSKETVSEPFQYLSNLTLWDNGDIVIGCGKPVASHLYEGWSFHIPRLFSGLEREVRDCLGR